MVGVLQTYDRSWCKLATVVLGAVISVMTGINSKVFDADPKTLLRSAKAARNVIKNLNGIILLIGDPTITAEGVAAQQAEFCAEIW